MTQETDGSSTYYGGQLLVAKEPVTGATSYGTVILGGANADNSGNDTYTQYKYNTDSNIAQRNLTIIGGNACNSIDTEANNSVTNVICIGAGSGATMYLNDSIYIGNANTPYTADNIHIGNNTLAAIISDVSSKGGVIENEVTPSDERLKNVGKPYTEGLDMIEKIEPVNFTYKRDENKYPHVGVIAQALQKIFPNAVQENKEGYLYIRTEDIFYAAINAIKELHQYFLGHDKRIQQLEARNAVLEQQNKELQELYTELAKRVERLDKKKTKNVNLTPMPVFEEETPKSEEKTEEEVKTEE